MWLNFPTGFMSFPHSQNNINSQEPKSQIISNSKYARCRVSQSHFNEELII